MLDGILSKIPPNYPVWLGGDFNLPDINWIENSFIPNGRYPAISKLLIDIIYNHNLQQMVTEPTRDGNILDLIFTNMPSLVQSVSILPGLSDHNVVSVEMLTSIQRLKSPRRKLFLYNKGNFEKINEDLDKYANSISETNLPLPFVNDLWINFKKVLIDSVNKHIP